MSAENDHLVQTVIRLEIEQAVLMRTVVMLMAELAMKSEDPAAALEAMIESEKAAVYGATSITDETQPGVQRVLQQSAVAREQIFKAAREVAGRMIVTRQGSAGTQ